MNEKKLISKLLELCLEDKEKSPSEIPFEEGKSYLIRTVTLYYTGRVVDIKGKFIQLEEAAWIADTGRWADASKDGSFKEIEPFANDPWINTDSVIDAQEITYKLPTNQK